MEGQRTGPQNRGDPVPTSRRNPVKRFAISTLTALSLPVLSAGCADTGHILEIDYDAGRLVIDDEWRSIRWESSIDHERGIVYVRDDEEPEGIMAFSLETGEWIRTYMVSTGEGPQELPGGIHGLSAASDGRLYVAGAQKVIEFGPQGQYLSTWIPRVPPRDGAVCELGGQPAVPALGGVVRRGDDGEDEAIGPVVTGDYDPDTWAQDGAIVEWQLWKSKIACTPHAAFVVAEYGTDLVPSEYDEESDSVTVYYRASNRKGRLLIPEALAVGQAETVGPEAVTDGRGNLVLVGVASVRLVGLWGGFKVTGAVVDPASGCHAVIRNPKSNLFERKLMGIYRDSAVVANEHYEDDGRGTVRFFNYAHQVGLYPLRRISGKPCAGMLPSVG